MKTTLIEKLSEPAKYPVLKSCNGGVVLFTEERTGVVVKSTPEWESCGQPVGDYATDWIEEEFKPLPPGSQAILEND